MSLHVCQQRAFDGMEAALQAGEQRLAARFAILARLTSGGGLRLDSTHLAHRRLR